jgi:hypothetical protein
MKLERFKIDHKTTLTYNITEEMYTYNFYIFNHSETNGTSDRHFINISNEIVNKTRFLHTSEQNQNVRRQTHLPQVHGKYPTIVEHVAARGQQMFLFPQAILRNVNPHRHDSSRCGGHDDAILR